MKKILIVDDDRAYQKVLTELFTEQGHEVIGAASGEEGYAKAVQEHPDLIILDVMMPHEHGLKALSRFKQGTEVQDIPVVVSTNYAEAEMLVKEQGAAVFLLKSETSNKQLIEKVEEVLQHNS